MKILGISASHDAGAALIEDGRILAAINEERIVRKKLFWGMPRMSIKEVLKMTNTKPNDIDHVAVSGITLSAGPAPDNISDYKKVSVKKKLAYHMLRGSIISRDITRKMLKFVFKKRGGEIRGYLKSLGIDAPVCFIEHHLAHAASAYYTSPYKNNSLVITTDAAGDFVCSVVCTPENYELIRRSDTSFYHSPARIYSYITYNLGFRPMRHEGKITGLAAYGNADKTWPIFRRIADVDMQRLKYKLNLGCWGGPGALKMHSLLWGHKREDIAAGVQKMVEDVAVKLAEAAVKKHGRENIVLAGGMFANVKVNQRVSEIPGVNSVYIHPHMGDGGLATGSALRLWSEKMIDKGKKPKPIPIDNIYFGNKYSNEEIEDSLRKAKLRYRYTKDVEGEIAGFLKNKKIVGRFNGRMEYGPRALGNRSILADPTDKTINDWLNKRLARSEFMPFAPVILRENANECYKNFGPGEVAAQFMTITFDVKKHTIESAPAVVHVDNTARPQTITKKQNPSYYKILREYERLTGLPLLVNTSFNTHEEPIIRSPEDAIRSFKNGSVDVLAMGDFIVEIPKK